MQTLLNRLGRSAAAAFMAFAMAAIVDGAVCTATIPSPTAAPAAVAQV